MHVLLEGIAQYDIRLVLGKMIKEKRFTLAELNEALASYSYGYTERKNKPEFIHPSVFSTDGYKLKLNAENTRILCKILPFLLHSLGVDLKSTLCQFLLELLSIIQLVFSPVVSEASVQYLKDVIAEYLQSFGELFPENHLLPKHHYLVHIPNLITTCGPPVRSSCIRFEALHQFFKRIAQKMSFKNICLSIAIKYQEKICCDFVDEVGENALYSSSHIQGPSRLLSDIERDALIQQGLSPGTLYSLNWLTIYGQKFVNKQAVVAVDVDISTELPLFGELEQIILNNGKFLFCCSLFETIRFHPDYLAYEVEKVVEKETVFYTPAELLDYNVYHMVESENQFFVTIKYSLIDIVTEHLRGQNPLNMS